jgi:hypothetical protein
MRVVGERHRFRGTQAQALHAGIEREYGRAAAGVPAAGGPLFNIPGRIQNRGKSVTVEFAFGIVTHQPVEDIYDRTGSNCFPQRDSFIDAGNEKISATGAGQRFPCLFNADAVTVCLDNGRAGARRRQVRKGTPVFGDRVQVDRQDGAGATGGGSGQNGTSPGGGAPPESRGSPYSSSSRLSNLVASG